MSDNQRAAGVALTAENFPDPVFRKVIAKNFDFNDDGFLSEE